MKGKFVVFDNETYYRKSNGQLILEVSRSLSDEEYTKWVNNNQAQLDKYATDKEAYPGHVEEYGKQKKRWDIYQAELKLKELRNS